jgi:predicted XRE-type DNA-binding protein
MAKSTDRSVTRGTANVFADLGFPDAETHLLKAQLVTRMRDLIAAEGLTQAEAAARMGVAQPDVSRLLRGRFRDYSVERLNRLLVALDSTSET